MSFEYQIHFRNLSKKGIQKFQDIENNYESLREALSSDPEETFGMMREEIWEIECDVESGSGMIVGLIKTAFPDGMLELFTRLHQNLIDAGRIGTLGVAKVDVSSSISQQEEVRDGAWSRVQGDIDYAQGQIESLRGQLTTLISAVNDLREKGVEVITTDEGGVFQSATNETIDYVAQANVLFDQQQDQRNQIRDDIRQQQDNINKYRLQAKETIDGAKETYAVLHIFDESYQNYASYKMESSDEGISAIKDSCILDYHEVHEHVILNSEGIMEIQAEIYEDLNIELDEDWDWDDIIYPDPRRIMQSAVYYDFFHDNVVSALGSLQEELEEGWGVYKYKYHLRDGLP